MKIITISTDGVICQKDVSENGNSLYEVIKKEIGGWMENVYPRRLPRGLVMVVNEEGLILGLPLNPIGSYLYETDKHGCPIVGNIVILKEGIHLGERDIVGIPDDEVNDVMNALNSILSEMG